MSYNVSDINRAPPPLGQLTVPFRGKIDPLAFRLQAIAYAHAERIGCKVEDAFLMMNNAVTPSRRWLR